MRTYTQAVAWLEKNDTQAELGFNPDSQCLRIARLAREIPALYATAKMAQDATPAEHRVHKVEDLRKGMVAFFDDPKDSNKAGHIATIIGRVKGADPKKLSDVLFKTNSVVPGKLVTVRGDYFEKHWGDKFQFGATQLNGVNIDYRGYRKPSQSTEKFDDDRPRYAVGVLDGAAHAGNLQADKTRKKIDALVAELPDDDGETRVSRFKHAYATTRILRMGLLNAAVTEGKRDGEVKTIQLELKKLVKGVPDH